jgi:hypothetical protein
VTDIRSPRWLYIKGLLFVLLGGLSAGILLAEAPSFRVAIWLALSIWAFCRAYYFAFYVIEHYVDSSHKFAGLWSFARYVLSRKGNRRAAAADPIERWGQ